MKQFHFRNGFFKAVERLIRISPDWITGKSEIMKQKYYMRYGARDYGRIIQRNKVQMMSIYILLTCLFLIFEFSSLINQMSAGEAIGSISRPGFGSSGQSVPVEARVKYKGYVLTKDITIHVKQKALSKTEKQKLLQDYKIRLAPLILGENTDLDHISKPLNLPDRDPETGITINWTSSLPELVTDQGEVDLIGAKDNEIVELKADLTFEDVSAEQVYRLKLDTDAEDNDFTRSMSGRLKQSIEQVAETDYSDAVTLPEELGDGVQVRWYTGKEGGGIIFAVIFLIAVMITYQKRYDRINQEIKEAEGSIARDLPEFINKLVLLLNAGLVVSTAMSKIAEDYEMLYHTGVDEKKRQRRYLYEELLDIQKRVIRSNASLIRELREFSQRCGVREMVRITAVISDNWDKGSMLAEKLEREGELLWISRKKRAEEKGKLAETKLTFPLMILLIVLIMITIAPAMMEM